MADYNSSYTGTQIDTAVANANNALRTNTQTLTEAQITQVLENLGFSYVKDI